VQRLAGWILPTGSGPALLGGIIKIPAKWSLLGFAVFMAAFPSSGPAQSAGLGRTDSVLVNILAHMLPIEWRSVRIASRATGRVQGSRLYLRGDTVIVVSEEQSERAIAVADVDSVWVQRGTLALTLGLVTGVPCALYVGLVAATFASDPDSNGGPAREATAAVLGGALGGVVCGAIGSGIGSLIRRWRLEFARSAIASP
jgi:hypothetical protein